MSKFVLTNCRVFVGGVDLSGDTNEATITATKQDKDVTNYLSNGWNERIGGLGSAAIKVAGFWEAGTQPLDDNLWPNLGLLGGITIAPQGAADQALAYAANTLETKFDPFTGKVGDVAAFEADVLTTRPLLRGVIGVPPGNLLTTTGTGTINQLGAVGATQSLWADLHVISIAGTTPSVTFSVQSAASVGFGSPTTRLTFSAATGLGGQWLNATGPITDQFWRFAWTISGTNPSVLASGFFGIM